MPFSVRDIGYTVYSRYEDAFRKWLHNRLLVLFADRWTDQIPSGVKSKVADRLAMASPDLQQLDEALAQTDLPDLMEIVCFRGSFIKFLPEAGFDADSFHKHLLLIYQYRNKIAHVDPLFTKSDLMHLVGLTEEHLPFLGQYGADLASVIAGLDDPKNPDIVHIPIGFAAQAEAPNNLPEADFELEGGFIGRGEELGKLKRYLQGNLDRVITITGAGGVGKTALALRLCQSFLRTKPTPFDAIVWTSAKEEKLGLTGIEAVEPSLGSFEDLIDSVLTTLGWQDELQEPLDERLESISVILNAGDRGILIVVDNLETVRDERILDFIKELPPPNKALLTSRIGLGEIERRYPLGALNAKEAVLLFKMIARDKGLKDLANLPENTVATYTERLHRYPLAIKWTLGQLSLGKDVNAVVVDSASATGDIARFCFNHIFDNFLLQNEKLVLYALSSQDQPLSKGALSHLTELPVDSVEVSIQNLVRASLIIAQHKPDHTGAIITSYELLGLTKSYSYSKLQSEKDILERIRRRMAQVSVVIDQGTRAKAQYKYTFRDMDAVTEEEKIAATWCMNAYQKYQSGDYASAVQMFESAIKIAPEMPTAYRNWARMEIEAGFYSRAHELINKAVALRPNDPRMWREWGSIEMKAQNYDVAAEKVTHALQLAQDDEQLQNLLAEIEKRRGNHAAADTLYRRALGQMRANGNKDHVLITTTAMADNLRKWAEQFKEDPETQKAKLGEAYNLIRDVTSGDKSPKADATFREIAYALANFYEKGRNEAEALRLYDASISWQPMRDSDKSKAVHAAVYITDSLLRRDQRDAARRYLDLARAYCRPPAHHIHALELEYTQERKQGRLTDIFRDKGYGFLSYDQGMSIFLHFRNIIPACTITEFESFRGLEFSFLIGNHDGRPTAVRACATREMGKQGFATTLG